MAASAGGFNVPYQAHVVNAPVIRVTADENNLQAVLPDNGLLHNLHASERSDSDVESKDSLDKKSAFDASWEKLAPAELAKRWHEELLSRSAKVC